jgi:hypothetical protein
MNSSTPMPVAMHSMPLSPEDPALVALPDTENPGRGCQGPGFILGRVTWRIYSGKICREILHTSGYCDEREERYGSFLGLDLFRLVVSQLWWYRIWYRVHRCHPYPDSWSITGDPCYLRYRTMTRASRSSLFCGYNTRRRLLHAVLDLPPFDRWGRQSEGAWQ